MKDCAQACPEDGQRSIPVQLDFFPLPDNRDSSAAGSIGVFSLFPKNV